MPRRPRVAPGGWAYHVLNRSVGKMRMFRRDEDFEAFERVLVEAHERHPIRLQAWCVMPTHWHFVVWPAANGQVTAFFRWLTHTHAMRWRTSRRTLGYGHLYQGRFKSFAIQRDGHFLTVCRYVERNALSAGLVRRAEDWRWSSLWVQHNGSAEQRALIAPWPVPRPADWADLVNAPLTRKELERIEIAAHRGRPFGDRAWTARAVKRLGLEHTVRRAGRPSLRDPGADRCPNSADADSEGN